MGRGWREREEVEAEERGERKWRERRGIGIGVKTLDEQFVRRRIR